MVRQRTNFHLKPRIALLALAGVVLVTVSCKLMPGWKQLSDSETNRMERTTEEKIQNSESFRALNDLCTRQIPIYETFAYKSKSSSWKGSDYLSIFYKSPDPSDAEWKKVKTFYKLFFASAGWKLTDEEDASWGPSKMEHQNEQYVVRIYFKGLGDADYGFHCANLPETDENGKPKR